jgi:CheY-like chemotaxis protein
VHASTGREAADVAEREPFDLILMDVQISDMDGFEATRCIRKFERTLGRRTPIVAMTAQVVAGDRDRCLAAGMDDYISKPLKKAELLDLLQRNCAKRMSPISPNLSADTKTPAVISTTSPLVISKPIGDVFTTGPPSLDPGSPPISSEVTLI